MVKRKVRPTDDGFVRLFSTVPKSAVRRIVHDFTSSIKPLMFNRTVRLIVTLLYFFKPQKILSLKTDIFYNPRQDLVKVQCNFLI